MNRNRPTLKETFETARQNYIKRDFKTAETLCYKILSINHNHFESKSLLADIFSKTDIQPTLVLIDILLIISYIKIPKKGKIKYIK